MSNDDENKRLMTLLSNFNLSSLLSLASSQANNRPGTIGLPANHSSMESSSSVSVSVSALLSALSGSNSVSAPAPAPTLASSPRNNTNELVLSALLGSTSAASNQAATPTAQATLAQLLGMNSSPARAQTQGSAPTSAHLDLQRLLQGTRPEPSTSRSSHASANNSVDQRVLSLLRTPPSANTATVSVDAVLAMLNSGMDRERMIALLHQVQNTPPTPPPSTQSLQALLQKVSNRDSAPNINSINGASNQLLSQLLTNLPPSTLANLLAAQGSQQQTNIPTATTTNSGPQNIARSNLQVTPTPVTTTSAAASCTSGGAQAQAQASAVISTDSRKSKSSKKAATCTGKRKSPRAPGAPLPRAPKGLTGHKPQTLYSEGDDERLSAFHVLARKNMEFFEADQEGVTTNARGRNKPIALGQAGTRCKHCSFIPPRFRDRGAMYYPFKLELLYQACQTLSQVHLSEHCKNVPKERKLRLKKLKQEKATALVGKKYWAETARRCGIYETADGMRFRAPTSTKMVDPPEQRKEEEEQDGGEEEEEDSGSETKKRKAN